MSDVRKEYLIEVGSQERERETLRRFCETPFMLDELLASLGLPAGFYWVMQGLQHSALVAGREGDVDLVAGRLAIEDMGKLDLLRAKYQTDSPNLPESQHIYFAALELAAAGGLQWPPPLDYLVAIEAKCAYFDSEQSRVKSKKSSPSKIREVRVQIEELLKIVPFDRVALLDFIVNPPASGFAGDAWFSAAATAAKSFQIMRPTLADRLPPDSPAGHFAIPWGAVMGGTESLRGAGSSLRLRPAIRNPYLSGSDVLAQRRELEGNLWRILAQQSRPFSFPVIF